MIESRPVRRLGEVNLELRSRDVAEATGNYKWIVIAGSAAVLGFLFRDEIRTLFQAVVPRSRGAGA